MGGPCICDSERPAAGPRHVRPIIRRIAGAAGIDGVVTPYDLRHTGELGPLCSDVALELLADLLGHVDTRMVFRHYRHPVTPIIDVVADYIEGDIKA